VRDVVDHRAAVPARRARVASGRDVEGDRPLRGLHAGPQPVELGQVVVPRLGVVRAPVRLARQGEAAEALRRGALDLGDRAVQIAGRDGGERRHHGVVRAEGLPGPLVVDAAHGVREHGVGGGPHRQTLVGEDHLRVDAVGVQVAQPLFGFGPRLRTHQVLALEPGLAQLLRPEALHHAPAHAAGVDLDARQAVAVLRVDALAPQPRGLVRVGVGRDHEVLVRVARARGPRPADTARCRGAPGVRIGDRLRTQDRFLHCTSVCCSWSSKSGSTSAPMSTGARGSPARLPIMRIPPAPGSSTSTTR
jgi:hypothetical protein